MKRLSRPMTRADWAWVLNCFICGTLFALVGLAVELDRNRPHYGKKYTFVTSDEGKTSEKVEQVLSPVYARSVTIKTNGDVSKIIQAAHQVDPDCSTVPYSTHPPYSFFTDWLGAFFGIMMISCLFRLLEKVCQRLLGLPLNLQGVGIGNSQPEIKS